MLIFPRKIMTFSMIYDHFYDHIFQIYSMFVRYFFWTELFSHYHLNLKKATIATAGVIRNIFLYRKHLDFE